MEEKILMAAMKEARNAIRAPGSVKDTFLVLLEAYLTKSDAKSLHIPQDDHDDQLRNRITSLRKALKGIIFRLPNGKGLEFTIPHGQPYRLEEATTSSVNMLWKPHLHRKEVVLIQTFERLFFRWESAYIRDLRVNRVEEAGKIEELLKIPRDQLSSSMHYVSSGELRAAITLQNFFVENDQQARLISGPDLSEDTARSRNLILLGAARVEATYLSAPRPYEKFRIVDYGVRPELRDKTQNDGHHRTVFVLMSRRHGTQRDSVIDVFESSHGRAIHGVCEQLADSETNLCADVVSHLSNGGGPLPEIFQVVFKVTLAPNAKNILISAQIEIAASEAYRTNIDPPII
jgi:hypothetical protein